MEKSKQRLYQKSLWQAVNLLSQLPHTYHPSPLDCLEVGSVYGWALLLL